MKTGNNSKEIIRIYIFYNTTQVIKANDFSCTYFEIVHDLFTIHLQFNLIVVKQLIRVHSVHRMAFFTNYEKNSVHIIAGCSESDRHFLVNPRLCRGYVIFCCVTKQSLLVEDRTHTADIL